MPAVTEADVHRLIEEHLPLVRHVVFQVAVHFPRHVDREELATAGALGLVEAARRYDESRGVPFDRFAAHELHEYLAMVKSRIAVLHGQFSAIVTPEVIDHMFGVLGRNAPFVEIPQAHHHVPLDQPLALIAALRALLADWEHSVPPIRRHVDGRISVQWRWTSKQGRPEIGASYRAPRHYSRR